MRILFLGSGNSSRSQMAEGLAKTMAGEDVGIFSAGIKAQGLHPRAVQVMEEIGIDISQQSSDTINRPLLATMDYAITLCEDAHDHCPLTSSNVKRYYWPFPDPAKAQGSREEILAEFRRVRELIARRVKIFFSTVQ